MRWRHAQDCECKDGTCSSILHCYNVFFIVGRVKDTCPSFIAFTRETGNNKDVTAEQILLHSEVYLLWSIATTRSSWFDSSLMWWFDILAFWTSWWGESFLTFDPTWPQRHSSGLVHSERHCSALLLPSHLQDRPGLRQGNRRREENGGRAFKF